MQALGEVSETVAGVKIVALHREHDANAVVARRGQAEQRRDIRGGLGRGAELLELVHND
jgi:hypothetical protein